MADILYFIGLRKSSAIGHLKTNILWSTGSRRGKREERKQAISAGDAEKNHPDIEIM
jgi:hypothetical protein